MADITLDQVLEMWEKDSAPDYNNIGDNALLISKLHSKYLKIFSDHKLKLVSKKANLDILRKNKWYWVAGKLSREDMARLGWQPFQLEVSKSKYMELIDGDEDVVKLNFLVSYHEAVVEATKSILFHLKDRSTNHRTAMEHLRYVQGG